jgi:hypothetical protein
MSLTREPVAGIPAWCVRRRSPPAITSSVSPGYRENEYGWSRNFAGSVRALDRAGSRLARPSPFFQVCNHTVLYCAHRASTFRSCALREQDGRAGGALCLFIFVDSSFVSSSLHKASGWHRSGSQPPAAGSLHRAGCEDGWVRSATGPAGFTSFLSSPVPLRGWLRAF